MLLCIPNTKLLWFQRRLAFNNFAKRFSINLQSSSAPESQVTYSLDEECNDFLSWLEHIAGVKISDVLSIGKSTYGRSLFASKFIHGGDCILKVPYSVQMTPDELPPNIKASLTDEVGNIGKLAAFLLIEKKKGHNSRWTPYISRLPRFAEMHSTIFWSEDELDMIRCSAIHEETIKQKVLIEKEFLVIARALNQYLPGVYDGMALQDFIGITSMGNLKGLISDFLNHDGVSESIVLSDEDKQLSEVIADRDYRPGEEVLIRYGRFSNATLLLDFGFTLPYNIHDQVQIQMKIPNHDPLCKMKSELLQSHHTRSIKDINIYCSSWDSFLIKEVKSANGRGKGIPQSLRAFARVLCCTSPEELRNLSMEAAQNDGRLARLPLRDSGKEVRAHQLLSSHINKLIEEHNACIQALEAFDPHLKSVSRKFGVRIQMARDLLMGELRVLRSAAAWLSHYCTTATADASTVQSL